MTSIWDERQRAFAERLRQYALSDLEQGTIVVVPSLTFPVSELRKITAVVRYEERMLFTTLFLRNTELRLVYVTSLPVDPEVAEYYLRLLPDPAGARKRLQLVNVEDPDPRPLSDKLLDRPSAVREIRDLVPDPDEAYVLTFNVTDSERKLSDALEIPLYGHHPDLAWFGTKTGSRLTARRAGVAVLEGRENLYALPQIESAIEGIRAHSPHAEAVVVKLNHGFSGQGNAILELAGPTTPLTSAKTTFCAAEESWPSFAAKIAGDGAIVEELVRHESMVSPSVQMRIAPTGYLEVVSTHDQVLGGPDNQVYLGCRFPADPDYRLAIQTDAMKVGEVLAAEGVIGFFGVDFLVAAGVGGNHVYLSEINLRMGGTTHTFWMARLLTGGTYDLATGELWAGGQPVRYVATDNLKSERLVGRSPAEVIDAVDRSGLSFDPSTNRGVTLHLLGALREHGKMGMTCIAHSLQEADDLYAEAVAALRDVTAAG